MGDITDQREKGGEQTMTLAEPQALNEDFGNVVVVDNCPVIGTKKFDRLVAVLRKTFSKWGSIVDNGLYMPVDEETQKTVGYFFVEYESKEMAQKAVEEGNNKKLDSKHTLRVNLFDDIDEYSNKSDVMEEPKQSEFNQSVANQTAWLLDDLGRDQFVVRHGDDTDVCWNDPMRRPNENGREVAISDQYTERGVAWSPKGSYLATFHQNTVKLRLGENFIVKGEFKHPGVNVVDFSPCEQYLVTSNGEDAQRKGGPECIIVWDIRSGKKLRGFPKGNARTWPVFKWSFDDKYLARLSRDKTGTDQVSVYQTPDMGLLDKKSFKVPGVREVQWSPSDHIMAYWVPEKDNNPAEVALVEVPSRKLIRKRHAFAVADVRMHWQEKGDYLAVKFKRMKSKNTSSTQFEIFRMRNKDVPVEEFQLSDQVLAFAWQPAGSKFAIIHAPQATPRPQVSLYQLKSRKLQLLKMYENRPANALFFAPQGDGLVIAGLGQLNGALEFIDTRSQESYVETEHFMTSDVEWDPSGRYLITSVCQPLGGGNNFRYTMDNGYKVWSAQGELLATQALERCYQVLWRPRPPSLLTYQELQEVRKSLREKYWLKFLAEDDKLRLGNQSEEARARLEMKDAWKLYRAECVKEYEEQAEMRRNLRGGVLSDDEDDYVEQDVTVEEVISSTKEIVPMS